MSDAPDPSILPKHQYSVAIELAAPIDQCFAAASAESAMAAWVPNHKSVTYDHSKAPFPYGPGSSRTVVLTSGVSLVEVIFLSEKPTLVGYYIPHFGFGIDALLKHYQGRMHFDALSPTRTRLTWKGYFDCPGVGRLFEPLLRMAMKGLIATMAGKMQTYMARPH